MENQSKNGGAMKRVVILLISIVFGMSVKSYAQIDPILAGMITLYSEKAQKTLAAQELALAAISTGHIWTNEEVKATMSIQRKYNEYLDKFQDIITYAAEIYGFYYEVSRMTENFGELNKQLTASPSNALAVALTPRKNMIYRDLIMMSVDIVNDIRQVCMGDSKMTQSERVAILFGIRPKLRAVNRKLALLARAVHYTSLSDVWRELDGRARAPIDKGRISDAAFRRWRDKGKIKIDPVKPGGGSSGGIGIGGFIDIGGGITPGGGGGLKPGGGGLTPGGGGTIKPSDPSLELPLDSLKPIEPLEPFEPISPIFPPLTPDNPGYDKKPTTDWETILKDSTLLKP